MNLFVQIPKNHPSYADHFPDMPIVPGAVLLDLILQVCVDAGFKTQFLKSCKFLYSPEPGEAAILTVDSQTHDQWRVVLRSGETELVRATLQR